jgi:PDZ domain-containing protein
VIREAGATIREVSRPALRRAGLKPADVIVAIDGHAVRNLADLRRLLSRRRPGDRVTLAVRHGGATRTVRVTTAQDPTQKRTILGVTVATATRIGKLPVPVRINAGKVGGPSAGVAFALQVMEELGRDVDHGLKVAATGTIEADGSVGAIGGVKQKTIGARQAKVDVFLVPAGDNARVARRYADGLRVVPVETFRQALRVLATPVRRN